MAEGKRNPKVEAMIAARPWAEEMKALREIVLQTPLTEEIKWGQPCYTSDGKNIVLIHGFKDYCALLFMKGALMKDPKKLLIQQTDNVQSARQIRFTALKEIVGARAALKGYVEDAIAVEKAGLSVEKKKTAEFPYPEEFRAKAGRGAGPCRRLRGADAGPPARLPAAFRRRQAIEDPARPDREMRPGDPGGQGPRRLAASPERP